MNSYSNLILTPTPRLARALARELAEAHIARGETAWPRGEVMSWSGWMNRLLGDWLLETGDTRTPLTGPQANTIWSQLIDRDVFLAAGRVARMAERSWRELHEWGLPVPEHWPRLMLNEDSRQFRRWTAAWRKRLERENRLDPIAWQSELPDRIAAGEIPLAESITLHGFELPPTPLMTRIVEAIEAAGVGVRRERAPPHAKVGILKAAADRDDELRQAAAWARGRMEDHGHRVAIVVPDLERRVADVDRILRETLQPDGFRLAPEKPPPWHVSLGEPLTRWPLAADALRVLDSDPGQLDILEFGTLLRSPFLAGWNLERHGRAMLDAVLRALPGDRVTLFRVQKELRDELPEMSARLEDWKQCREHAADRAAPSDWSQQFGNELKALGLGAGRTLDSVEFQLLDAWKELLEQFAALDAVFQALTRQSALDRLKELARGRVFREQNPGVPIEVTGLFEALGGQFDGLWVTGMDEASWPPPARPDPLLPRELQKARPESTADGMLEQSRRILEGLERTAPEVVFSWAVTDGDEALGPSRLLKQVSGSPENQKCIPSPARGEGPGRERDRSRIFEDPALDDSQAPAHPGGRVRGGAGLLANQSACPFRALAVHRLEAGALEHPRAGLDARYRGILLHAALEYFWRKVGNSEGLAKILADSESGTRSRRAPPTESVIQTSAEYAVSALLDHNLLALSPAQRELETERLAGRLRDWLELESRRPPFRVTQAEQWLKLEVGGLTLRGKLDRIDALEDGRTVLIDYKTGAVNTRNWYPEERLRDPQLPLYYLHVEPPPAAIAFACLRPDRIGWQGLAESELEIDGVNPLEKAGRAWSDVEDWNTLAAGWRARIAGLAVEFRSGLAAVEPRDPNVCTYCHLGALCRIREKTG